jgi:hypothetical protein
MSNRAGWVPVVGYEEPYEVSDRGQVRSRYVPGHGGRLGARWRLLKPGIDSSGYQTVVLCLHGKQTTHRIHNLVADAFLPPKGPTDRVVRHLNDIKTDDRLENLARGTYSDNMADSIRNGKHVSPKLRGSAHGCAKLTEDNVREIRSLYATGNFTLAELGLRFGVTLQSIGYIVLRKTWRHIA